MNTRIALTLATTLILSLSFTNTAFAFWRVSQDTDNGQRTYGIRSGDNIVNMGLTKKQAEKLAKKLNKIEKKDAKNPDE